MLGQRYHLAGVRRCARHTLCDELMVRRDVDTLKIFIPDYAPASLTILHVRIQKRQNQSAITVRSDLPSREKSARSSRAHAAPATPSRRPILVPCEFCAFRSDWNDVIGAECRRKYLKYSLFFPDIHTDTTNSESILEAWVSICGR